VKLTLTFGLGYFVLFDIFYMTKWSSKKKKNKGNTCCFAFGQFADTKWKLLPISNRNTHLSHKSPSKCDLLAIHISYFGS